MNLYTFDSSGYYTGIHNIVDIYAAQPSGTSIEPPNIPDGKVALCVGDKWNIVDKPQKQEIQLSIEDFDNALTKHLDATAQSRRYDNRITCALRAGYTGPFQAEGQAFASWMDSCNWQAYQVLSGVKAGTLSMPTIEEFISDLPEMVWPV